MKHLAKAMLAVMADCPYVLKASVSGLNYTIAREADFLRVVRPSMLKHGIAFFVVKAEPVMRESFTTVKGTPMTSTAMKLTCKFVHAESGEEQTVEAIGEGMDSGDKGYPKAHTIALKYCLRQSLLVETGDDPDLERPEEQAPPPPPRPMPPAPVAKVETLPPAEPAEPDGWLDACAAVVKHYLALYQPGKEDAWPSMTTAIYAAAAPRKPRVGDITYEEAKALVAKLREKNRGRVIDPALDDRFDALADALIDFDTLESQPTEDAK